MSDDVKVKFGGDFSDVSKGAKEAVSNAGSAMGSWFKDFGKSVEGSIISSFAATAVFGKIKDNIADALHYFRELDLTIRRVGGSSADFQKLAGAGKQVGVSMETVGRSVNFLNKYLGQAAQGSKSHQQSLMQMGFTMDEIIGGNVSAIEVISRLGDEYDRTGNDAVVAAKAMELFGRSGSSLIPIIKLGREELKEMTKDMKVYSEETIRTASETQKNVEKMERAWSKFGRSMVESYSEYFVASQARSEAASAFEQGIAGGGTEQQKATSTVQSIKSSVGDSQVAMRAAIETMIKMADESHGEYSRVAQLTIAPLQAALDEMSKAKPKKAVSEEMLQTSSAPALAVSSLQAIGGGDVASIFAGTYQDTMLAQTTRIADATTKTAENTVPTPFRQPGPQPATK